MIVYNAYMDAQLHYFNTKAVDPCDETWNRIIALEFKTRKMCWSLEASALTAAFEIFCFAVVLYRSLTSTKKDDKDKFYLLFGIGLNVICVEVIEVLLWMKRNEILPITEGIHGTCSARNANLTRLLVLAVYSQPVTTYWMFGKLSNAQVNDRLVAPKIIAKIFFVCISIQLFIGEYYGIAQKSVEYSTTMGPEGPQTCTFLGEHGHLQWMIKLYAPWFLPNSSVYMMLTLLPCFLGLPIKILVYHCVLFWMVVVCLIYVEGSFEAGSIWCWAGISAFSLMLVEPYLPLLRLEDEKDV